MIYLLKIDSVNATYISTILRPFFEITRKKTCRRKKFFPRGQTWFFREPPSHSLVHIV